MFVVVAIVVRLLPSISVPPQPTPDLNGPGTALLSTLGGWAAGILLVVGVLGVIVGAILIIAGSHFRAGDMKSRGWVAVVSSAAGVVVGGSASAIISASTGFSIF